MDVVFREAWSRHTICFSIVWCVFCDTAYETLGSMPTVKLSTQCLVPTSRVYGRARVILYFATRFTYHILVFASARLVRRCRRGAGGDGSAAAWSALGAQAASQTWTPVHSRMFSNQTLGCVISPLSWQWRERPLGLLPSWCALHVMRPLRVLALFLPNINENW